MTSHGQLQNDGTSTDRGPTDLPTPLNRRTTLQKRELYEEAREAGIEGRSSMTKDELREALNE